jgi:putative phosphoesterase
VIALLGDTHLPRGSRRLPTDCVELLGRARLIVHTGDFTGIDVLRELEALDAVVAAVHGNMDDATLRALLPETRIVEHDGLRIGVVHNSGARVGRHERLLARFPNCHLIAYGHSHEPEVARVGDVWIVNPGSPTERRRAPRHTMAVVEAGVPRLVEL